MWLSTRYLNARVHSCDPLKLRSNIIPILTSGSARWLVHYQIEINARVVGRLESRKLQEANKVRLFVSEIHLSSIQSEYVKMKEETEDFFV